MSKEIYDTFKKELNISITVARARDLHSLILDFENRRDHALTLNSQLLGVYPISFTADDRNEFFSIFDVSRSELIELIKGIRAIDNSMIVLSDPMNQLIGWLLHLGINTRSIPGREKDKFLSNLALLWHYKFFTSLVRHNFPYKANEEIMRAAVSNLSSKFDIVKYGTWRDVLLVRSLDLISNKSIHYKTIKDYKDDKRILYMISDTQSRIREKVKKIVASYYSTKEIGDAIGSYSSTGELDGEKVLVNQISTFDIMINNINRDLVNVYSFLDDKLIKMVASMFKNIRPDMLKFILVKMSEVASTQIKSGDIELDTKIKGTEIYVGMRILTSNLIQKSYRFCIKEHVPMHSKVAILKRLKDVYSSSRISDPGLVKVKDSVSYFIDQHGNTRREATNASLRIAIILYIISKTFKYL